VVAPACSIAVTSLRIQLRANTSGAHVGLLHDDGLGVGARVDQAIGRHVPEIAVDDGVEQDVQEEARVVLKTNDVVKVLTIIGTIFIPLTFLAGVYGMNMPIPENGSPLAYPLFWLVCVVVATSMVVWFRRRGWL
jgi:hypothetical protein